MNPRKTAKQEPPPDRVTVGDVIEYHRDKDTCDMCQRGEWDCPQHPYNPHNARRRVSAVVDNRYYIAYIHGSPIQLDANGRARNGFKAPLYASVLAGTVREAKAKFECGDVEKWLS